MTNEELKKLMEFIVTQQAEMSIKQAEITAQQAEITAQQAEITAKQDGFATKQAQIMDIHFETAKRLAEFEKITENRIQFIIEHQAAFDIKLEKLSDDVKDLIGGLRQVSKRVDKLEDDKKKK